MHITKIDSYRDGGTIVYTTDVGDIYQDFRMRTNEKGILWHGYPSHEGSRKLSEEDVVKFWEALCAFAIDITVDWHKVCYNKSIDALRSVYKVQENYL